MTFARFDSLAKRAEAFEKPALSLLAALRAALLNSLSGFFRLLDSLPSGDENRGETPSGRRFNWKLASFELV